MSAYSGIAWAACLSQGAQRAATALFFMNKLPGDPSDSMQDPSGAAGNDAATADSQEDFRLVSLAQAGDMRAYDALVTRHQGKVYAMIKNMVRNDADAWDLSQEAFVKAWQALPRFEARARFSTWLFRISHNVVYDWVRKRKIESAGELNDEIFDREKIDASARTAPAIIEAPDEALASSELREKIESALAKLTPDHREVVILKDVQGLSYKEIAEVMDSTLGTVMSRLFYARQKLQTLLKDEYQSR